MKVIRTILDADKRNQGVRSADLLNIDSGNFPGQHSLEWLGQRLRSVPDPFGDSHYFSRVLSFLPEVYNPVHRDSFSGLLQNIMEKEKGLCNHLA